MRLFRVFVAQAGARPRAPGHALHIPAHRQGRGRIDNPDLYSVLYAADSPVGAIAEVFGDLTVWTDLMFEAGAGHVRALAEFQLDRERVCDLDDPHELVARGLRPSRIITPDRETTRSWARALYEERRFAGARWWSRYDSRWATVGLWKTSRLKLVRVERLHRAHPAVEEAAETLARTWREDP